MKKPLFRLLSLALCAAMLAVPAAAGEGPSDPLIMPISAQVPARMGPVQIWGSATRLEDGSLLIENDTDGAVHDAVIVRLGDAPVLDAVSGLPLAPDSLKDGDTVYAWVGPAMTMSLPPQTSATVVVANIPADYAVPQYYEVAEIQPQAVAAIYPAPPLTKVTLTAVGGTTLTITDDAVLAPHLTKNIVTLESLAPGEHILVWKDAAGAVTKVLVFPYAYRGYIDWSEENQVRLSGQLLDAPGRTVDGVVYLPVRAVAQAVGCDVTWESGKGAVVSATGETVFSVLPGASEAQTPDGGWSFLGTCFIDQGVTYLPAEALSMLLNLFWNY